MFAMTSPAALAESVPALALLALAGAVASGINAVAGGGSLISFPTLVGLGVPELPANATNSVALWPGSLAGAVGFLNQLAKTGRYLGALLPPTLLGSISGAVLLMNTSKEAFRVAVPILILFATLMLAYQPRIRKAFLRRDKRLHPTSGVLLQFAISVYGGYFGAGMGILMLASLGLLMEGDIHELNAIKAWLGLLINLVASAIFLWKGLVVLAPALALTVGSIVGGYAAAVCSQRVDSERLRRWIVALGFVMVAWFSYKVATG